MSSVVLTTPEEAESTKIAVLPKEKKEAIVTTQVDYSNHRYIFQRLTGETDQILVLREDGSAPSFEEIQPVVDLVLQFNWLQERYRELYFHGFGDYMTYRELVESLMQVESHFAEYSDVFPRSAFTRVAEMANTLVKIFDLIAKTMQQIEVSLEIEVLSEIKALNLQKDLATVIEAYQKQVIVILQNIGSYHQINQYLQRHISLWQIKWRRMQNRLNAILEEFQGDLASDGKWFEEVDIPDHLLLPDEEKSKAYKILENQKLLLKEA